MAQKLETDDNKVMQAEVRSAPDRSQRMAAALSSYARALTFENRSRRNLYRLAGLAPRTRDRVFATLMMIIVGVTFVLPMIGSIFYYVFWATPGYVSEVRFIVRSSVPLLSRDRYSSDAVEPKAKIVQDTAVLLNYLASPAIIQDLRAELDMHTVYGRGDIDVFSRLATDATRDEILEYWKKRSAAHVSPKSGIVELKITAFTPEDAHNLAELVLKLAERRVNQLSSGMWGGLLATTQRDVDNATNEVSDLRGRLRDTQNQTGVFDIELSAETIISVLTNVEASIAEVKSRRLALSQTVGPGSPQLSDLDRRLMGLEEQARELRSRTAGASRDGGENLADFSSVFDKLKLDLQMAESKLKLAIEDLEKVKLVSTLQLVYVDSFTEPTLPDNSSYPNVPVAIFLKLLMFAAVCGVSSGAVLVLRKKLD
ncbi:hypothetical protein [Ensifer sp. Root127]|uniref:hypothetical protein n=1 Tax=Ensifer sp. Root127 TaxID=1736440 RepID=UPI00070E2DB6|nr:hypothetical protein [Ensifer sp. Root127]KQW54772.1 hypothetical protein ASD03_19575 [Ensifer sp. Root127]